MSGSARMCDNIMSIMTVGPPSKSNHNLDDAIYYILVKLLIHFRLTDSIPRIIWSAHNYYGSSIMGDRERVNQYSKNRFSFVLIGHVEAPHTIFSVFLEIEMRHRQRRHLKSIFSPASISLSFLRSLQLTDRSPLIVFIIPKQLRCFQYRVTLIAMASVFQVHWREFTVCNANATCCDVGA